MPRTIPETKRHAKKPTYCPTCSQWSSGDPNEHPCTIRLLRVIRIYSRKRNAASYEQRRRMVQRRHRKGSKVRDVHDRAVEILMRDKGEG